MLKTMLLVAHLFDSSPAFQAISQPAQVGMVQTVDVTRLDGVTVTLDGSSVRRLSSRTGSSRTLLDDGTILAVDPDGRTWRL